MKIYNKLVRDKIPEIIKENDNKDCKIRVLNNEEYLEELNKKLQEEVKEYLESGEVEEVADIEEVLRAILKAKEVSAPIVIGSNIVVLQLKEEIQAENSTGDTMNFMYPYYVSQFDQAAISKFFMSSKKLENNFICVIISYCPKFCEKHL